MCVGKLEIWICWKELLLLMSTFSTCFKPILPNGRRFLCLRHHNHHHKRSHSLVDRFFFIIFVSLFFMTVQTKSLHMVFSFTFYFKSFSLGVCCFCFNGNFRRFFFCLVTVRYGPVQLSRTAEHNRIFVIIWPLLQRTFHITIASLLTRFSFHFHLMQWF